MTVSVAQPTRREIAASAVRELWEARESDNEYLFETQEQLATAVGVINPETLGDALAHFGQEQCNIAHPGYVLTVVISKGYRITDRLGIMEFRMERGRVRKAITTLKRVASTLKARRNSTITRRIGNRLDEFITLALAPILADLDEVIVGEEKAEFRRLRKSRV